MFAASGLIPAAPGGRPVVWAATGRSGGVSLPPYDSLNLADHVGDDSQAVQRNRVLVQENIGARGLAVIDAVHGARIAAVDAPGTPAQCDGLVTRTPGLALLALGADCAVVGLVGNRTIAVVHCGWQGLVADVVGEGVRKVREHDDVRAVVIGPAICGACYPVPAERASAVARSVAMGEAVVTTCLDGQQGIDVRAGVRSRLMGLGIPSEVIVDVLGCTAENPGLFSHRRDGRTGRHGLIVMIDMMD